MISNHTQLLNALIQKHGLKSYLEIGVQNPYKNFFLINIGLKKGVDPAIDEVHGFLCESGTDIIVCEYDIFKHTSNQFFSLNKDKFDIIFIDGDHSKEQVKKDFENSLNCLTDNGYIVIHDCLPKEEKTTLIPRQTRVWHGDVYQFCMSIRNHYFDIGFVTYNIDEGCMLIWKELNKSYTSWNEMPFNWECYLKFGKVLMNVVNEVII